MDNKNRRILILILIATLYASSVIYKNVWYPLQAKEVQTLVSDDTNSNNNYFVIRNKITADLLAEKINNKDITSLDYDSLYSKGFLNQGNLVYSFKEGIIFRDNLKLKINFFGLNYNEHYYLVSVDGNNNAKVEEMRAVDFHTHLDEGLYREEMGPLAKYGKSKITLKRTNEGRRVIDVKFTK